MTWQGSAECGVSTGNAALVLVDVLSDLEFPGGDELLPPARSMAERLAPLKQRARRSGVPVVYVNAEENRFKPSLKRRLERCLDEGARSKPVVELLRPEEEDHFVLHSNPAGFPWQLEKLFHSMGVDTLILTGMAASICMMLTAGDAWLSAMRLFVPHDCVASRSEADKKSALEQLRGWLDVDTSPSHEVMFV